MKRPVYLIVLMILLLGLGACGKKQLPAPVPPTTPPRAADTARQAKDLLDRGEKEFRQARYYEADRLFTEFLRDYPDQPGQDLAWLRHAQIQLWSGFPDGARQSLQYVLEVQPPSGLRPLANLILAGVELAGERPLAALSALAECPVTDLKPWEKTDYYHLTAQARFSLKQPKAALVALVKAYRQAQATVKPSLEKRLSGFVSQWPLETLESLSPLYTSRFPSAWILMGLAEKAAQANDWAKVKRYKAQIAEMFPGPGGGEEQDQPKEDAESGGGVILIPPQTVGESAPEKSEDKAETKYDQRNYTIGCLLPLSGPLADYGQRLLKGVQLALDSFHQGSNFTLLIEDTANDPLTAVSGLDTLAANPEVMAVIGPLSGTLALRLAERADELRLPLITLTQRPDVAGKSQWVFRDFLTPADLLEALAQRAVEKLGLTKIAILKPENRYGIRMAEIMTQAVERHGGRVVKSVSYTPGTYDLSQQMMALGGREPGSTPREEPLPYQALFIPEDAQALVQVAPQLTFYGLNGFVLLGTNLWHEDRLIAQAGPYVQDAVIPSVFFADSEAAPVKDFVAAYRDAYGETPELFAALGYDASRMVADSLWGGGVSTREGFIKVFSKISGYPGITGTTRMSPQGEAVKEPYLLIIRGDRFESAPTEPFVPGQGGREY